MSGSRTGTASPAAEDAATPALREPLRLGRLEVLWMLVAGAAVDAAVRTPGIGVVEVAAFVALSTGVLATSRIRQRQGQLAAAVAMVFATWGMVRASPWLVPLDLLAAVLVLTVGVAAAREGDLADLTWPRLLLRTAWASGHVVAAPVYLASAISERGRSSRSRRAASRVMFGLVLATPVVAVLAALLASADAVFADLLRSPIPPAQLASHAALVAGGACVTVGFLAAADRPADPSILPPHRRLIGRMEAMVVLASLVGVFALFAVAQLLALSAGGRHVIETAGLTYAEYARSGYFQLLAVAAITLAVLLGLRAFADLGTPGAARWFTGLGHTTVALTLVVLVVALRRLDLYENAFGLTMLRLYGEVFAWWLAVVFILLAVSMTDYGSRRGWFPLGALAAGLVALLALNVVNPEAIVVRRNLDHFEATGRFDVIYPEWLSEDAVPTVIDGLDRLDADHRADVVDGLCRRQLDKDGIAGYNLARARARDRLDSLCGRT